MALIKDILEIYADGETEIEVEGTCADCDEIVTATLNFDDPVEIRGWRSECECGEVEFSSTLDEFKNFNKRQLCELLRFNPSEPVEAL